MLKPAFKSVFILVALLTLSTCIDPYNPKLTGYASLLVVDGLLTDANTSYTVRLSQTFQNENSSSSLISDASVFISDNENNKFPYTYKGGGIYKTDSTQFRGTIGKTYILHVITHEGEEFESEPCLLEPVSDIDSLYFEKDQELINNGTQTQEGIRIFLDSKEGINNQYYRWAFDETWKFKIPSPKRFNFNMADSAITPVADVKEYCWKNKKSDNILIYSNYSGQAGSIKRQPLFFIASDQSDRLLIQYSMLVNQYSISKREYDFWNNMKQINENTGDIFAKQPFTVISNIKNVNNPTERVLGYFQVSAVKQRRKNISLSDILGLDLPYFHYSCERFVKDPADYPKGPGAIPTTWDDIYSMFCITSDYYFVEPQYSSGAGSKKNISKLIFSRPECADCELTGTRKKPDFWVDLK
jgi:hypothetical protein